VREDRDFGTDASWRTRMNRINALLIFAVAAVLLLIILAMLFATMDGGLRTGPTLTPRL
jgi:hypothetical protein